MAFLSDIISHAQANLYLDKPIEGSFPLFDVLKLIQDLFGGNVFYINKSKSFEPVNLLAKTGLLESKALFIFLVNSLKSSWTAVRHNSYELLSKYADAFSLFNDKKFVNEQLVATALEFCNDPRAMMAEASALMLKLAFIKCIDVV